MCSLQGDQSKLRTRMNSVNGDFFQKLSRATDSPESSSVSLIPQGRGEPTSRRLAVSYSKALCELGGGGKKQGLNPDPIQMLCIT